MDKRINRRHRFPAILLLILGLAALSAAANWTAPAQQLAHKISTKTGPGAVAISFKNASSLNAGDMSDARRAIEQALRAAGIRFVPADQANALLRITMSENATGYVWIGEVHPATGDDAVVMVAVPRSDAGGASRVPTPVTIRKQLLWLQADQLLDAVVVDASGSDPHLLVLAPERINIFRKNAGRWEPEQELPVAHARPWPRDMRGRLMPRKDHPFDVFLPGVMCASSGKGPFTLTCRDSDDPWPLTVADQPPQYAAYGAQRNFFNGALRPGFGATRSTAAFYSAAGLPRANYTLWLFAGVDGALRMTDGVNERVIGPRGWGSDVAVVMNGCGGPQAVITAAGDANTADSVVALDSDVPEHEPAVVSQPLEFSGPVTALWSAPDGGSALAVSKNLKTGQYEAYTLTLVCAQ